MARTKKVTKGSDGKRKETRAEKHARIESQRQAREACLKILPYVGGFVLVCVILFGLYVRSVPPRQPKSPIHIEPLQGMPPGGGQAQPDFMNVQVDPSLSGEEAQQAALEEAMRLMKERDEAAAAAEGEKEGGAAAEPAEEEVQEL